MHTGIGILGGGGRGCGYRHIGNLVRVLCRTIHTSIYYYSVD